LSEETSFTTGELPVEIVPFDISSLFNRDVVLNPGDDTNDFFDVGQSYLLEDRFDGRRSGVPEAQGLPRDRVVGIHRLGDYDGPNAFQATSRDRDPVRLDVPSGKYSHLRFLVAGGNGDSEVPVLLQYSDGNSQECVLACDDWFEDHPPDRVGSLHPGVVPVRNGMDRFFKGEFQDANDPALFEVLVAADPAKELEAIVLRLDKAIYAGSQRAPTTYFNLFAVAGIRMRSP
jgi:hypothetical protein